MRLTFATPDLMDKVWLWGDICSELRKWKKNQYNCASWDEDLVVGPRGALELVSLVLNHTHGWFQYQEGLKAKMEKEKTKERSQDRLLFFREAKQKERS